MSFCLDLPSNNFFVTISLFCAICGYFSNFLMAKSHQNTLQIIPFNKILLESCPPNPSRGDMATIYYFFYYYSKYSQHCSNIPKLIKFTVKKTKFLGGAYSERLALI